ncbi:hypothetical protein G7054_g12567 [Neopestalotiopsis clavispora]|nr:hypothetical protein G7054_g12567 [Neopestalotiopsis clavispora]
MNHNQPEDMASYGAYNSYPEATTDDYSRTVPSYAKIAQYLAENRPQNNPQVVPESYNQGQGQHMIRNLSNDSYTSSPLSQSTVESPETPMTVAGMSDWDASYPPSDQVQYSPEFYGSDQQWYQDESTYSTGYMDPPNSYIMSPVDNIDPVNYQYPQSMSLPMSMSTPRTTATMVPMQAQVMMPEVEVPNTSHMCTVPGCESKTSFKRKADLMRHFEQIHQAADQKKQFYCDYSKCDRSQDPFGRIDHFRQHYRDFHGEDLPRKSGESSNWYADKKQSVSKRSWRCVKCLSKVNIKDCGFTCDNCNTPCEAQRRQIRGYT